MGVVHPGCNVWYRTLMMLRSGLCALLGPNVVVGYCLLTGRNRSRIILASLLIVEIGQPTKRDLQ